jgi:hypothetical protein
LIEAEWQRAGGIFGQQSPHDKVNGDTPGARLVKSADALQLAKQTGRVRLVIGQLTPDTEAKSLLARVRWAFHRALLCRPTETLESCHWRGGL